MRLSWSWCILTTRMVQNKQLMKSFMDGEARQFLQIGGRGSDEDDSSDRRLVVFSTPYNRRMA